MVKVTSARAPKRKRMPMRGWWDSTILFRGKKYYYYGQAASVGEGKKMAKELMRLGYKVRLIRKTGILRWTGVYTNPDYTPAYS